MAATERVLHVGSIPAAAALICMGHEPLRVDASIDGTRKFIAFPTAAQDALDSFYAAKRRVDRLLDGDESVARPIRAHLVERRQA